MKAMSRVTSEGLRTCCLCLDLGLAILLLGLLPLTHLVMIFLSAKKKRRKKRRRKNTLLPIIQKTAMRKFIPIEYYKSLSLHVFSILKKKKKLNVTFPDMNRKWSHQTMLRVLVLMRKDNNHFPGGSNNEFYLHNQIHSGPE